jgi:hypothetical protein
MKNIFSSATKIVLLAITIALIAFTFLGKVDGKDFMTIALMVFAFYFGQKTNSTTNEIG